MIDKTALYDDLIRAFMNNQLYADSSMPLATETPKDIRLKYLSDPIFHAKVESLTAGVMHILDRHIEQSSNAEVRRIQAELDAANALNNAAGVTILEQEGRNIKLQQQNTVLREALSQLVSDSMASDFNEHWESYIKAVKTLAATETDNG